MTAARMKKARHLGCKNAAKLILPPLKHNTQEAGTDRKV
jgi:hypothetical protein